MPCTPAALAPELEPPEEAPLAPVEPDEPDRDGAAAGAGTGSTIFGTPPPEPAARRLSGTYTGCGQIPALPPSPWAMSGTEV
jgi:hypothetical protein